MTLIFWEPSKKGLDFNHLLVKNPALMCRSATLSPLIVANDTLMPL